MSTERIDPQFHEAVVTYSRVEPREQGFDEDLVPAGRREPTIDATEIHVLDGRDDADLGFAVRSERRADEPLAVAADLGLDEKRSPVSRIVFATAALSIVAGVGVLAATVGIATITPSRTPAETAASAPPALAAVDPAEEAASSSGIRAIPLATGKDAGTASVAPKQVEPPLPRARPEEASVTTVSTKSESAPAKAELRPSSDPVKPDVATLPPPVKSVPTLPPPAPAAPPAVAQVTPASADGGNTDALISSIEETLAKRDASSGPPPGSLDPHGMEVLPEGEGPVAVLPPPASMAPNYPAPQGSYPSSPVVAGPTYPAGPTYDVVPPAPVTGNGYGNTYPADAYPSPAYPAQAYPSGPVPPADVPYSYPSRPMEYEVIPEKRPGLLRRTWMRTADAVTRVFTRDREEIEPPPQY